MSLFTVFCSLLESEVTLKFDITSTNRVIFLFERLQAELFNLPLPTLLTLPDSPMETFCFFINYRIVLSYS